MKLAEFNDSLVDDKKTLLHFSAVWCTPCRLMEPFVTEFLGENPEINYIKIDVDNADNAELLQEFNIRSVPTMITFDGKNKIRFSTGAIAKSELSLLWELYD